MEPNLIDFFIPGREETVKPEKQINGWIKRWKYLGHAIKLTYGGTLLPLQAR